MKKLKRFKIFGTEKNKQKSLELDEISIISDAATLRDIGVFFINSAHEMDQKNVEHLHLQDRILGFSYEEQSDIILINKRKIQLE